ncbi:MAG: response regulator transcription factor [Actinobacteria bacterium]|nr:response regulator transcription factor [Actinomycetota bacterium]
MADVSAPRVLVVDDEENISFLVESALHLDGIDTSKAADGFAALAAVKSFQPHAIVLDVNMPGIDGFEVLRRLRTDGDQTPVVFLTARDGLDDRVKGLTSGADDYVVKPFAIAELVARVRIALRHAGAATASSVLALADLELDQDAHRVVRAGQPVTLSPTEYKLLRYLMLNAGRVLSRAQILDHVWSYDFDGDSSVVETYMSYLRRKVDHVEPKLLHTVRGVGYCLRVDR